MSVFVVLNLTDESFKKVTEWQNCDSRPPVGLKHLPFHSGIFVGKYLWSVVTLVYLDEEK